MPFPQDVGWPYNDKCDAAVYLALSTPADVLLLAVVVFYYEIILCQLMWTLERGIDALPVSEGGMVPTMFAVKAPRIAGFITSLGIIHCTCGRFLHRVIGFKIYLIGHGYHPLDEPQSRWVSLSAFRVCLAVAWASIQSLPVCTSCAACRLGDDLGDCRGEVCSCKGQAQCRAKFPSGEFQSHCKNLVPVV